MRLTERLLLGDSTKRLAEIESESVDLILTDPPHHGHESAEVRCREWIAECGTRGDCMPRAAQRYGFSPQREYRIELRVQLLGTESAAGIGDLLEQALMRIPIAAGARTGSSLTLCVLCPASQSRRRDAAARLARRGARHALLCVVGGFTTERGSREPRASRAATRSGRAVVAVLVAFDPEISSFRKAGGRLVLVRLPSAKRIPTNKK